MPLQSGGYTFKPHEMPFMPGSPASPEHPKKRRLAYLAIGLLLALSSGFQNGLLTASLPQLRGDLSLDLQQGGWIQAAYFMAYACMSVLFFKVRKAYGLQRFVRITLFAQLAASLLQLVYHHYEVELIACVAAAVAASGLLVLSIYYMMQGFTGTKKLVGLVIGLGLMQVGTPLAQSLVPLLYGDGNLNGVFAFQATLALACTACLFALPLPPGITVRKSFTLTDALSFTLFASGIALLCAFLVQGRTVWWTTQWLGWLLAGGVGLTGLALYIESTRHKPMLDWHWMTVPQMLIFAVMGAMARLLTSEQTVGAAGLMGAVGVGSAQMSTFYLIVAGGMLAGVVGSLILLDINDIRRPVMVALACFALGAWLEIGVGMQTRPAQLYFSQFIVAFASLLFMGPMMLEGALRALAKSPDHMMSFSAVFGLSQTLGGLAGKEASVAAYSDLFALLAAMAAVSTLVAVALWLYRRYYKIDILAAEKAALNKTAQDKASAFAVSKANQAAIDNARAQLDRARREWQRIQAVSADAVSQSSRDAAQTAVKQAEAGLKQAQEQYAVAQQNIINTGVGREGAQAGIANAQALLDLAKQDLGHTVIYAPASGKLGEVSVKQGQLVSAGTQLMSVVPSERWIIANIKETDMANVKIGQSASVSIDALGGKAFSGKVAEISPATASEFSLIKADSGTGNFVKIAQRIAVKIVFDAGQQDLERLAPGMSAEVNIATK